MQQRILLKVLKLEKILIFAFLMGTSFGFAMTWIADDKIHVVLHYIKQSGELVWSMKLLYKFFVMYVTINCLASALITAAIIVMIQCLLETLIHDIKIIQKYDQLNLKLDKRFQKNIRTHLLLCIYRYQKLIE